jgi:hypothetical protein
VSLWKIDHLDCIQEAKTVHGVILLLSLQDATMQQVQHSCERGGRCIVPILQVAIY